MEKLTFKQNYKKKQDGLSAPKVPRLLLFFSSFIVLCFISQPWANSDKFQMLLLANGSFDHVPADEREMACSKVMQVAFSSVLLFGLAAKPLLYFLGSRYCSVVGTLLVMGAYSIYFFSFVPWLYYAASLMLGLSFQLLISAHVETAVLFPGVSNLMLGIIASGADISYFVTLLMSGLMPIMTPQKIVITFLTTGCLIPLCLSFIGLPKTPYSFQIKQSVEEDVELNQTGEKKRNPLEFMATYEQIKQPEFWIIVSYLFVNYARKKFMITDQRRIFSEIGAGQDTNTLSVLLSWMLPFGFIVSVGWSSLVDRFGVISLTFLSNGLAIIYLVLLLIPSVNLQYLTIVVFICVQAFVYNHMLACLNVIFGIINTSVLQGYVSTITGVLLLCWDYLYPVIFEKVLKKSYKYSNVMMLLFSLIAFLAPSLLAWTSKRRRIASESKRVCTEL